MRFPYPSPLTRGRGSKALSLFITHHPEVAEGLDPTDTPNALREVAERPFTSCRIL
jgi:hypothetical protein